MVTASSNRPRRAVILFPTTNADVSDLHTLAVRCRPKIELIIADLPWPAGAAESLAAMTDDDLLDSVQSLGSLDTINEVAARFAADDGDPADVVMLAVNSASFTLTPVVRHEQINTLASMFGCPATTATQAFEDIISAEQLTKVSVASVYPTVFTDRFITCVEDAGAAVVHRVDANARTDADLAAWNVNKSSTSSPRRRIRTLKLYCCLKPRYTPNT